MKWLSRILTVIATMSMACGALVFNRRHQLKAKTPNFNHKALIIIIPARNEEKRISHSLHLTIQQQIPVDVTTMNDGSTDKIACVACLYSTTVVDVVDDADGKWYGKSHARYQDMTHTCTSRIALVDADITFLRKDTVEALINQYQLQGEKGLLSVRPYHITKRFYEGFSAIFNLMTVVGMNVFSTLDGGRTSQHAFEPVTLTNKEDYCAARSHKNTNRHIIEELALESTYTSQSLPVTVYEGFPFVAFHIYQEGLQSLQEGWTKHLSTGADGIKPRIMAAAVSWLFGSIVSILKPRPSLKYRQMPVGKMLTVYLSYITQSIHSRRRVSQFSNLLMVCYPLSFILFTKIFTQSRGQTHRYGIVKWRSCQYSIPKEQ